MLYTVGVIIIAVGALVGALGLLRERLRETPP